jgi:protein tyrosine phosphatase
MTPVREDDIYTCSGSRLSTDRTDSDCYMHGSDIFIFYVLGPSGRVFLSRYPYEDENSEYINAVYVDGFRIKDQFVVTQFPLPSTLGDFWRLVAEKSISLIVVVNEVDEKIKVCYMLASKN